ncbi:hypothetical protein [Streptomyces sp. NPDC017529]|uniref:hypothetical protein n=1 Tax=Streptomyces sp. NPDC017529 TaxID=3365000 RepID=UPI0037B8C0BD
MRTGDAIAHHALATGQRTSATTGPGDTLHLSFTLADGTTQHFTRNRPGGPEDWRAGLQESQNGNCTFNEPVSAARGRGLDLIASRLTGSVK